VSVDIAQDAAAACNGHRPHAEVNVSAFGAGGVPYKINNCAMKAFPVVVYAPTVVVASHAIAK
jgi:hypothetical protein